MRFVFNSSSIWMVLALTGFYIFLTPQIFFRHDDWLMLGNSVIFLPRDWSFLWQASWYVTPSTEEIWFFRPWFKLAVWAGYHLFSFQSWLWTLSHWSLILLSSLFGGLALKSLSASSRSFHFFLSLFLTSLSFHFACVVWMGEGMMNAPQLLLLSLSVWGFSKKTFWGSFFSILFYTFSLGFKESSAFLPVFLLALSFSQGDLKRRWRLLIFFWGLMVAYLVFRLAFLPFNPGYKPHFTFHTFFKPIFYFVLILATPFISFLFIEKPSIQALQSLFKKYLPFSPFLSLSIAPHLGHTFFSPGWFLLPGFFGVWIFVYSLPSQKLNQMKSLWVLVLSFLLSATPIVWKAREIRWLDWHTSQKQVFEFLKDIPDTAEQIWIETCAPVENPSLSFERVVGSQGNLEFIRALLNKKAVPIKLFPCNEAPREKLASLKVAYGKWVFPDFSFEFLESR